MPLIYRAKMMLLGLFGIGLLALSGPALAAGTTPLALVPQVDTQGNVASNCQVTFYQAGTVATKQNVYSDFGLTQAMSNPIFCDQAGRVPMHWLADGLIHIRMISSSGVPIVDTTMQVLGPSSGGGGGGGTVDPTTIMATGDLKARYGTGPLSGFVRANGLTIGNASSGATERANADTQALFIYLCGADANLVMTPPRSGNCLTDYNANKVLATPDWRGRALAFLDDMGNSAAGRLSASYFGATATVLGAAGGAENVTMAANNLIQHTHANTLNDPGHTHGFGIGVSGGAPVGVPQGQSGGAAYSVNTGVGLTGMTITNAATGFASPTPMRTVQPTMLATIYMKL
jgi:hypothetical protein